MRLSLVLMLFSAQVVFTCPPGCGKRSFEGPPQVESGGIQSANDAKKKEEKERRKKRNAAEGRVPEAKEGITRNGYKVQCIH